MQLIVAPADASQGRVGFVISRKALSRAVDRNRLRRPVRAMLAESMERSPRRVAHLETNPRVMLDGDRASATTMFSVASTQEDGMARVTMLGHHHDELVRTEAGWRIQRRRNVVDLPETGHP